MTNLPEYREGVLPEAGMYLEYQNCANTDAYKPIEVSDSLETISKLTNISQKLESKVTSIKKNTIQLGEEWGSKYISINNKKLDIVDVEAANTSLDEINSGLDSQIERVKIFLEAVESGTNEVKEYLNKLKENNEKRIELENKIKNNNDQINQYNSSIKRELQKENPNTSTINTYYYKIASLEETNKELKNRLEQYNC